MQARKLKLNVKYKYITAIILVIVGVFLILGIMQTKYVFYTQQAAEQWQGDSDMDFTQVTVLIPEVSNYTQSNVMSFRQEIIKSLNKVSIEADDKSGHFYDCWSGNGSKTIYSDKGKAEVAVTPVGGDFFFFHPMKLLSGDYFRPDDFMHDRILIDEGTAWLLYGGVQIVDMPVYINDATFYIAGVIERETDKYSKDAYKSGNGIYVPFEAYYNVINSSPSDSASSGESTDSAAKNTVNLPITCYEIVLANPVKGFAANAVQENVKVDGKVVVTNTDRFNLDVLLGGLKTFFKRSMITSTVIYPYWENAARYATDSCHVRLFLAIVCFGVALLIVIKPAVVYTVKGYNKVMEMGDEASEKIKEKMHV